jgi:hypothetical protein
MTTPDDQFGPNEDAQSNEPTTAQAITADFRRDLAFPKLSEEMVQRQRGRTLSRSGDEV